MSDFNLAKEKKLLLANLQYLKSLPVEEYTFHKKCVELENNVDCFRMDIHTAEGSMWRPQNFEDESLTVSHIVNLKPKVIICDDKYLLEYWRIYRQYVSTGVFNASPGRFIQFLVVDSNDSESSRPRKFYGPDGYRLPFIWPVIGFGAVSSDFGSIKCRDDAIGWTSEQRYGGMLKHVANGATIVATQPFGFNFLGGKLIAALITSEIIRNEWQVLYGDVLAGMTTTSLFGFPSMYDNLEWWKRLDLTTGSLLLEPDIKFYRKWLRYVKNNSSKEFDEMMEQKEDVSGPVTNAKGKVLDLIYKTAGIPTKEFKTGYERGVYFSEFYENTKEFLCGKIPKSELKLKPLFKNDVDAIMKWWIPQAIGRYKMLKKKGRIKPDGHFYNHLGKMDYETAKEMFFDEVGR